MRNDAYIPDISPVLMTAPEAGAQRWNMMTHVFIAPSSFLPSFLLLLSFYEYFDCFYPSFLNS